jgi:hypothetical protein
MALRRSSSLSISSGHFRFLLHGEIGCHQKIYTYALENQDIYLTLTRHEKNIVVLYSRW